MPEPQVALGDTHASTPLNPSNSNLSSDGFYQQILDSTKGGSSTADFFTKLNVLNQLYSQINDDGESAWNEGEDYAGNPVHYVSKEDGQGKAYYMKVALEGVETDGDKIKTNEEELVLDGKTYKGVGIVFYEIGYNNLPMSKVVRGIGIAVGSAPLTKSFMPLIWKALKTVVRAASKVIRGLFSASAEGGAALEEVEIELQTLGEKEIAAEGEIAVDETLLEAGAIEGGAIAGGVLFFGAMIVIAVVLIALSFILHNSFHHLRVWNLTRYKLEWSYSLDEGRFYSGPIDFKKDKTVPIPGASCESHVPGVKPSKSPHVRFADFHAVSKNEITGIGYVLQMQLKDPKTDEVAYTATTYYDIPLTGDNSADITFDKVSDLQSWYNSNAGGHKSTTAERSSSDNAITVKSSYDYLVGEHAIPGKVGDSSNEGFYYQSVLCFIENDLKTIDLK